MGLAVSPAVPTTKVAIQVAVGGALTICWVVEKVTRLLQQLVCNGSYEELQQLRGRKGPAVTSDRAESHILVQFPLR